MKVVFKRVLVGFICVTVIVILSACTGANKAIPVAVFLSAASAEKTPQPDASTAPIQISTSTVATTPEPISSFSELAKEQKKGYEYIHPLASSAPILAIDYNAENDPQEEIAVKIRKLVEDKKQPVVALIGATSNEGSSRLASLSNFFNVPVIIPSAIGDNLLPSNNLWGFRLSAPGTAHSHYLFNDVLTHSMMQSTDDTNDLVTPEPFKVAILYEQDTFGESAAVAAAKEAMKQDIKIGFYGYVDPLNPDLVKLRTQVSEIRNIQLIYLIIDRADVASIVVKAINDGILQDERPILLGQSGAFSTEQFLDSPEAQGMYVLQQKISADNCPTGIKYLTEAQSYAAAELLRSVLQDSNAKGQPLDVSSSQPPAQKRETLRNALKATNIKDLPCLGQVSFDNAGQNKNLEFEILGVTSNGSTVIEPSDFIQKLKSTYELTNNPFGSGK